MNISKPKTILILLLLCVVGVVYQTGAWKWAVYRFEYIEVMWTSGLSRGKIGRLRWDRDSAPVFYEFYNIETELRANICLPNLRVIYSKSGKVKGVWESSRDKKIPPPYPDWVKPVTKADTPAWFYNDELFKDAK